MKPLKQTVINEYLKRKISYRELSKKYGITHITISKWIRDSGVITNYYKPLPKEEVISQYKQGLSVQKIADKFQVSISPVNLILKKSKITIRDNSERHMGQPAWNKGLPMLEEQKLKLSKIASKRTGNKNANWRGGIPRVSNPIRQTREYKTWVKTIKERDGKCMKCKSKEKLEAHHIIPVRTDKDFELVLSMDNGITLCHNCHKHLYKKEHEYADIFRKLLKKTHELRENPKGQS